MSTTPPAASGNQASNDERMALIRQGMDVFDAAGEHVGKIGDVLVGDPDADEVDRGEHSMVLGEGLALAMGGHREPNVPDGLVGRLLRMGYIKIDDRRHARRDHHYYATSDQVVSVEANTVRLSRTRDELITPAE